jgi:nucleoside-diphosphate-sugar epimerase
VGRHVVRRLIETDCTVINVDLVAPSEAHPGEDVQTSDIAALEKAEAVARRLGKIDGVVWLAARIRHRLGVDETAAQDLDLMVEAPRRMLIALEPAPRSFVNMSSVQVFGRPVKLPVDDDHPKNPFTAYGVAKLYGERVLDIAGFRRGTAVASLRVAFIYGPGQHPDNVLPRFIRAVRRGESPVVHGAGGDLRDDVYVGDVARAVELSLRHAARGSFIVASGRPHTILDVASEVCAFGSPGLTPIHDSTPSTWVDRWYATDRARDAFGFVANTPFSVGVRAMWDAQTVDDPR